jgi:hypothetical protein
MNGATTIVSDVPFDAKQVGGNGTSGFSGPTPNAPTPVPQQPIAGGMALNFNSPWFWILVGAAATLAAIYFLGQRRN